MNFLVRELIKKITHQVNGNLRNVGYFYNEFDAKEGAKQLKNAILNFDYKNHISPINDIRGTDAYRLEVAKVLVKNSII